MIINLQLPVKIGDSICFLKSRDEIKSATITEIHIIIIDETHPIVKLFWQKYEKDILKDEGSLYLDDLGKYFSIITQSNKT